MFVLKQGKFLVEAATHLTLKKLPQMLKLGQVLLGRIFSVERRVTLCGKATEDADLDVAEVNFVIEGGGLLAKRKSTQLFCLLAKRL